MRTSSFRSAPSLGSLVPISMAVVLAAPSVARAGDTGVELMVRPAYGSAGDKSPVQYEAKPLVIFPNPPGPGKIYEGTATPYGGGFVGEAYVGYRFIPWVSAGLSAGLRTSKASSVDDGTTDLSRSAWTIGPYVRGYVPLIPFIDPWISIGVGYTQDTQSYKRQGVDWTLTHNGIAVPITIGVDYKILMLAVGPSFQYTAVAAAGGCLKLSSGPFADKQCTDAGEATKITTAKSYGVWSIGLHVRVTL